MNWINHDCADIQAKMTLYRDGAQHGRAREWYVEKRCQFYNKINESFRDQIDLILPFGKNAGVNDGSPVNYGTINQAQFDVGYTIIQWLDDVCKILVNNQLPANEQYNNNDINKRQSDETGSPRLIVHRKAQAVAFYQAQGAGMKQFIDDLVDWLDWKIQSHYSGFDLRTWFTS